MSYSDNDNILGGLPHNNIIWETPKDESFGSSGTCCTGHVRERYDFIFEKVKCISPDLI
jgi:hypothetical protein